MRISEYTVTTKTFGGSSENSHPMYSPKYVITFIMDMITWFGYDRGSFKVIKDRKLIDMNQLIDDASYKLKGERL